MTVTDDDGAPIPTVTPTARQVADQAMPGMLRAVSAALAYLRTLQQNGAGTSVSVARQIAGLEALQVNLPALMTYTGQLEGIALGMAVLQETAVSPRSLETLLGLQAAYGAATPPVTQPATPAATPPSPPSPQGLGSLLPLVAWQQGWTVGWSAGRAASWPEGWLAGVRQLAADVLARIAARL